MVFGFISNLIFGDQGNKNDQELILLSSYTVNEYSIQNTVYQKLKASPGSSQIFINFEAS